jgi:hypothetical protein
MADVEARIKALEREVADLSTEVARMAQQMASKMDGKEADQLVNRQVRAQFKATKKKPQLLLPAGLLRKIDTIAEEPPEPSPIPEVLLPPGLMKRIKALEERKGTRS